MPLLLAASLFFTEPAPLEMPRAEAYLVQSSDAAATNVTYRLEDRFLPLDLWTTRAVIGRWMDEDGRVFMLSRLDVEPPPLADDAAKTRTDYVAGLVRVNPKKPKRLAEAIGLLAPIEPAVEPVRPHVKPRGYRDVQYWQGTNECTILCAYWPSDTNCWFLASWELAPDDLPADQLKVFEDSFLGKPREIPYTPLPATEGGERELLRADARHAVAAYPAWHVADGPTFTVLDNLSARGFTRTLTNELVRMRARYAAAVPASVDVKDTLCVARIYADRDDYLAAAGDDQTWTAAYWCPLRREIVAYLPPEGSEKLLRTFRHEAFHQYLSYASSMLSPSPWFNEGYAEYFEDEEDGDWGIPVDLDALAESMPKFLKLDYQAFYAGTDEGRHLKYRFAWSIARFIEKGCPEISFEPFKDLKRDYMASLLKTHDPHRATDDAFGSRDRVILFMTEWKRYWKTH